MMVSNCLRCQIVLFVVMVSNCPQCQIVLGVKLSYLPSWCKIVLGVKLSYHRILKLNFGQDSEAEVRSGNFEAKFGQVFKAEVWSRL